jgi:hypothetical protein
VRGGSNNIALALDFANAPDVSSPAFDVPTGPFASLCVPLGELLSYLDVPVSLPVPEAYPVGVPLPVVVQLPPVPGIDVPAPQIASAESARRRVEHEKELDVVRQLARAAGFKMRQA